MTAYKAYKSLIKWLDENKPKRYMVKTHLSLREFDKIVKESYQTQNKVCR